MNGEVNFFENSKKNWGGVGSGQGQVEGGGHGRCERRSEVFCEIKTRGPKVL